MTLPKPLAHLVDVQLFELMFFLVGWSRVVPLPDLAELLPVAGDHCDVLGVDRLIVEEELDPAVGVAADLTLSACSGEVADCLPIQDPGVTEQAAWCSP